MSSDIYTVGKYLVERLEQIGLRHLFLVPGDYTNDWLHKYVEPSNIEGVNATNELIAGYSADGYSRLNGIGAISVTYSVGALSALNAVAGSFVEQVPVVVINGAPSVVKRLQYAETGMLWHHMINGRDTDLNIYRNVTVAAERISNPALAPEQIDSVLRACLTERRPVYLETTEDIYDLPCAPPQGQIIAAPRLSDSKSLRGSLDSALSRLNSAKAPIVWAGAEVGRFGIQNELKGFIEKLNIPYVTSLSGKAVLSEDMPQFVGVYEGASSPQHVQEMFDHSDYILALGMWVNDVNLWGKTLPWDRLTLAARDSVKTGTEAYPQVTLVDFIEGLSQNSDDLGRYTDPKRPDPNRKPVGRNEKITYQGFFDQVTSLVHDSTIICGGTGFSWFGSSPIQIKRRGGYVAQAAYADIGYAVPASAGVALAAGRDSRVLVFAGDGGFQLTAQAISTLAANNLNPIIFVLDNGVYGIEQWISDPKVFKNEDSFWPSYVLHPWDSAMLCEALGGNGWKVETYAQLELAMTEAEANLGSPSLIQVSVLPKSLPELVEWKVKQA